MCIKWICNKIRKYIFREFSIKMKQEVYILREDNIIVGVSMDFDYLTQTLLNGHLQTKYGLFYDESNLRLCDTSTNYIIDDIGVSISIEKISLFDYYNLKKWVPKTKTLRKRLEGEFKHLPKEKKKKKIVKMKQEKKTWKRGSKELVIDWGLSFSMLTRGYTKSDVGIEQDISGVTFSRRLLKFKAVDEIEHIKFVIQQLKLRLKEIKK